MRAQHSKWYLRALAVCFVIAIGAVGCGDDSDDDGSGGSGGDSGGSGGAGGKGGTGGKGGGGGSSGGLSPEQCTTMTAALTVPVDCAECVCTKANTAAVKCLQNDECWPLINCVTIMCPDNPASCQVCTDMYPDGMSAAFGLAGALQTTCKAECPIEPDEDAGVDAGQ